MTQAITGSDQIWAYRWEDDGAYAQSPGEPSDTTWKAFGSSESVSEPDIDNNTEANYRPFSRTPERYKEMQFSGEWGTDYSLTNPWWLQFVFGEPSTTEVTAGEEYEHVFEEGQSVPKSAQILEETHHPDGTVSHDVYVGCIVNSADFDTSVENPVEVSLSGPYARSYTYENASDNSPISPLGSQPPSEYRELNQAESDLYMALDASEPERQGYIQDASFTFNMNAEVEYEIGTRFPTLTSFLNIEPEISYTARWTSDADQSRRKSVYGSQSANAPSETLSDDDAIAGELRFDAGPTNLQYKIEFTEGFPSDTSRPNTADPESAVDEEVTRNVTGLTITVTADQDIK